MNHLKLALLKAKSDPEWPKLTKNKTGRFKYADLFHMLDILEPALHKHGLVVNFEPVILDKEEYQVTVLEHPESGMKTQAISKIRPGKDDQAWGGCKTYQRRYGLMDILGIASTEDYDPDQGISPEQTTSLQNAIKIHGKFATQCYNDLLGVANIKELKQIDVNDFGSALDFIKNWKPK